jgi:hypothetical protein
MRSATKIGLTLFYIMLQMRSATKIGLILFYIMSQMWRNTKTLFVNTDLKSCLYELQWLDVHSKNLSKMFFLTERCHSWCSTTRRTGCPSRGPSTPTWGTPSWRSSSEQRDNKEPILSILQSQAVMGFEPGEGTNAKKLRAKFGFLLLMCSCSSTSDRIIIIYNYNYN